MNTEPTPQQGANDKPFEWDDVQVAMQELKAVAASLLSQEGNAGSVNPTQLMLSSFRKLIPKGLELGEARWDNREQFFGYAFRCMRQVLKDYARRRNRRGHVHVGSFETARIAPLIASGQLDLDSLTTDLATSSDLCEAVAVALEDLERLYSKQQLAAIVEHRVFNNLSQKHIGEMLNISEREIRKREKRAYTLLAKELQRFYRKLSKD